MRKVSTNDIYLSVVGGTVSVLKGGYFPIMDGLWRAAGKERTGFAVPKSSGERFRMIRDA
jgi:hypothetical protein